MHRWCGRCTEQSGERERERERERSHENHEEGCERFCGVQLVIQIQFLYYLSVQDIHFIKEGLLKTDPHPHVTLRIFQRHTHTLLGCHYSVVFYTVPCISHCNIIMFLLNCSDISTLYLTKQAECTGSSKKCWLGCVNSTLAWW